DLSILGFGCMRLPMAADRRIDEAAASSMLRYAIDHGVNYVDTAYPYHDGESEPFVGRALMNGYRERVHLATKLPCWQVSAREDMDRYLDEQLSRLRTDRIDFYLAHGLTAGTWERLQPLGLADFFDDAIADGRIRYAGFSFHDGIDAFRAIVDGYDWTVCQIQYNFMDEEYQAGTEGLRYAAERDLGVIVMEPIRGGMLATDIPSIRAIWNRDPVRRSLAERALRWVWNHPDVTVVLSGMSTMEQVTENVSSAYAGAPASIGAEELGLYDDVKAEYRRRIRIPCTGCGYCQPCPSGVNIPECFEAYNMGCIYDAPEASKVSYTWTTGGLLDGIPSCASLCQACGACEEKCPQRIAIRDRLKEVTEYFGR
ncbi:MAG: aldo/keto reductase, partial [Methanobacteriota archaeon]